MTNYPFYKKIIHSFYNKDLYIYSATSETQKTGLKYLLILLCVFWIPLIIKIQVSFGAFINSELPLIVSKIPVVEINNGIASFDKPSPYIITDDETGKDAIIFDDSGEYTSLENTDAKVLVTDTKFIYKKDAFETREYSLQNIQQFSLTHEKIMSWAEWGKFVPLLIYLVIVPLMFVYRSFLALIYTLIGLIFQAILQTKLSFQTIFRLSIIAFTPAFVIDKIFMMFNFDFTGWTFCCMVISLAYLFFGMKAIKDAEAMALSSPELGTDNSSGNSGIQ